MPHCTNCGDHVEATHHYCGNCGQPLSETAATEDESPLGIPPRHGFLTRRSITYIHELINGQRDVDRESVEYQRLAREFRGGLADLSIVAGVDELNLLHLWSVAAIGTEGEIPKSQVDADVRTDLAIDAFYRIPRMYDRMFGTEWEDEVASLFQQIHKADLDDLTDDGDDQGTPPAPN